MVKKFFIFIALLFASFIFVIIFIIPHILKADRIKARLTEKIKERYNYQIDIHSLYISLFPKIKIIGKKIEASSLPSTGYKLEIRADVFESSIKLIPLFQKKIEIGKILVDRPVVILKEKVKKSLIEGKDVPVRFHHPSPSSPLQKQGDEKKGYLTSFSVMGLVVKNGSFEIDSRELLPQRIRYVKLSRISLFASPLVSNRFMRINLKGNLEVKDNSKAPLFLRPIDISISERIKITDKEIILEKMKFNIESALMLMLSGRFSNFKEPLLKAKFSTGEVNLDSIKDFLNFGAGKDISGALRVDGTLSGPLNRYSFNSISGMLELKEARFKGPDTSFSGDGRLKFAVSTVLKEILSGSLDRAKIKGKISLSDVKFNKLYFQNLSSDFSYENSTVTLAPLESTLYGGKFNGTVRIILGNVFDFGLTAELDSISIDKLMADVSKKRDIIYGNLNSHLDIRGKGRDISQIAKALGGKIHIEIREGKITTFSLLREILKITNLFNILRGPNERDTRIYVLTADGVIGNGKITTDNIHLVSKELEAFGKGYMSFDQKVNFIMDAYLGTKGKGFKWIRGTIGRFMKDKHGRIVVPIKITGKIIPRPSVQLDVERLVVDFFNKDIKGFFPRIFN